MLALDWARSKLSKKRKTTSKGDSYGKVDMVYFEKGHHGKVDTLHLGRDYNTSATHRRRELVNMC